MPPVCCRCNASGSYKNCSCKKANRTCLNCLPHRRGCCANSVPQISLSATDPALTCPNPPSSLHTSIRVDEVTPPEAPELAGTQLSLTPAILTPAISTPAILPAIFTPANSTSATIADLPPFVPISTPNFRWGDVDGETFACSINRSYEVIVHWRRNLFKVPSGKAGKAFVRELTRMFRAYADGSALESVAMKAAMVMPALLLQKPHPRSKAKDHTFTS